MKFRRAMAMLGTASAMLAGPAAGAAAASCEEGPVSPSSLAQIESEFFALINSERASQGLPGLSADPRAADVARAHAGTMAAAGDIFHNEAYFEMHYELGAAMLAENVGTGCETKSLHEAFMESPSHRANILNDDLTHLGMGAAADAGGRLFVVQSFLTRVGARPVPTIPVAAPQTAPPATPPPPTPFAVTPAPPAPQPATPTTTPPATPSPEPVEFEAGLAPVAGAPTPSGATVTADGSAVSRTVPVTAAAALALALTLGALAALYLPRRRAEERSGF